MQRCIESLSPWGRLGVASWSPSVLKGGIYIRGRKRSVRLGERESVYGVDGPVDEERKQKLDGRNSQGRDR